MYLKIDTLNKVEDLPDCYDKPYLIKNGCKKFIAYKRWNIEYLKRKMRNCKLPVEKYESKKDMGKTKSKSVKKVEFDKIPDLVCREKSPFYYCAEVDLFRYQKNISPDIFYDTSLKSDDKRDVEGWLLFLGHNSKSGCHLHGESDFLLNQIIGKKTVYLFDFYDNPSLEMNDLYHFRSNFIKKNFFELDHKKYKIYKVDLNPGDSLAIPPWWFHAVQGYGLSCSLTKIFDRSDKFYYFTKPYLLALKYLTK